MTQTPGFPHDEALFRRIVEDSPAAVVLLSNEVAARVLYVSPRIEAISGFRPDELLTQPGLWISRLHPDEGPELGARWAHAVESGERFSAEYRFRHRTGEWRWLRETSAAVREPDGSIRYRQSFTEDITAERFAEAQAERSEARYRALVERLPAVVYVDSNDVAPTSLYVSPNAREILGYAPGDYLADPGLWNRSTHPDDIASVNEAWATSVRTGKPFHAEYRNLKPDGTVVWVRDQSVLVHDDDGQPISWQGVLLDITAERDATTRLRRSEARYRDLIEHLPVVVYVDAYGVSAGSRYVSPNVVDVLGFPAQAFITDTTMWFRMLHPDDRVRAHAAWSAGWASGEGWTVEYRFLHPAGDEVWVRDEARMVIDPTTGLQTWQGVLIDLTSEKSAEHDLRRSEQRYRALVEQVPAVVYLDWYGEGNRRTTFSSPRVEELTGIAPERWTADPDLWQSVIHPDDLVRVRDEMTACIEQERTLDIEYRWRHTDGRDVWVHDTCSPVLGEDGTADYWLGVMLDITEQRETEQRLLTNERRYRALVEQVPAVMYEMGPDDERRTLFVSPHVEEILGYPRQEWLDQPDIWQELLHPDDRETELAAHDHHNETGEPWQREYRLIASDGREVWVSDQGELVTDDEGQRWLGVMLDITPRKDAEELLRLANDELEMRVLTRTTELEDANEMMSLEIGERRRIEAELRAAQQHYRSIVEQLPGVVYTWRVPDPGDPIRHPDTYTSPRIEDLLGFTPGEWEQDGRFWETRVHPHDRDRVLEAAERSRREFVPFNEEFRFLAKDGRVVWVLEHATVVDRGDTGDPRFFQGAIIDITDRKLAEEKATVAEERFRLLAERGPVVFYLYELEHVDQPVIHMHYVSPSAADLLSMPIERWEGDLGGWMEHMHPDDVPRMRAIAEDVLATGRAWDHTFRMIAGDGRIIWLLDRGRAIEWDERGRPKLFQGVLLDVTAEQETRAAIEASEAQHRSIVETMPAVPWTEVTDPTTGSSRYVFIGPQVEDLFGYLPAELLMEPDHFFRLVHPDDRERLIAASERCDRTGERWNELYRVVHRDGSVHWIVSHADRAIEDGRPVWHGISMDVTLHVASGAIPINVGEGQQAEPG